MPLKTRDGVAEAPIEPGLRMLCEPCVFGPAMEAMTLDRSREALADPDARDLDRLARLERLDRDRLADHQLGAAAELDQVTMGLQPCLLQVTQLRPRHLPLGDGREGELDGLVSVGLERLHLDDGARPGLDHRHGRDHPGLRVEELCHPQLPADDAFHCSLPTLSNMLAVEIKLLTA